MNTILTDCRALVHVTPEMEQLRKCPECARNSANAQVGPPVWLPAVCQTCKGINLNPDMKPWWEALKGAENTRVLHKLHADLLRKRIIVFKEWKYVFKKGDMGYCGDRNIHRPAGDDRPWNEVLKDLIENHCTVSDVTHVEGKPFLQGWKADPSVAFAIATPESAGVFKGFGIETLVRA